MIKYTLTSTVASTHLVTPTVLDITADVLKGVAFLTETAFDLNKVTTPSDSNIVLDNTKGKYDLFTGFFSEEITSYIMTMSEKQNDVDIVMFVGLLSDIEYKDTRATLDVTSVIRNIINMDIPRPDFGNYSFTGTPSDFIQDILTNQAVLPGLFINTVIFTRMAEVELELGIEIIVDIQNTDKVSLADIIQEVYKLTGLYVYSQNGVMTVFRLGDLPQVTAENYDFLWLPNQIIADKSKLTRPLEWQKTRWIVESTAGKVARNMNDFFNDGASILAQFKEKKVEADGLDGKIKHTSVDSAIASLNQLLGWRGFPRYQFSTVVDTIDRENKAQIQAVPLFSINRFEWLGGCITGILIDKQITETEGRLTILSIVDPIMKNPYNVLYPYVTNVNGKIFFTAQDSMTVFYEFGLNSGTLEFPDNLLYEFDNPNLDTVRFKVKPNDGCNTFGDWFYIDSTFDSFILGANSMGHVL